MAVSPSDFLALRDHDGREPQLKGCCFLTRGC
jgi:hypothetical protein